MNIQRIGIFGGTFDPFHIGHLTIAGCFIEKCNLDKCFIVPARCSPFKVSKSKLYSDIERIKIIENKIVTVPELELSRYEIDKEAEKISYSIDTVRYFKNIYCSGELYLLIGYDVALSFSSWKDYKEILELVKIVIANRPEQHTINEDLQIAEIFKYADYIWLDNPIIDITSTKIREGQNYVINN